MKQFSTKEWLYIVGALTVAALAVLVYCEVIILKSG